MNKTIIALSTPPGMGGIAVLRMSGSMSATIAQKILVQLSCGKELQFNKKTHRIMQLCYFKNNTVTDKVMAVYFKAPFSYTGEDVVEIHTHGNSELAEQVIKSAIEYGAQQAQAGEFTMRAFLNGKMDLTAAEGIIDLIEAKGAAQIKAAHALSEGVLYHSLNNIFNDLIELGAQAESAIDYPEEDLEEITENQLKIKIKQIVRVLKELLDGYNGGRVIKEGAKVVLCGKANTGKSMLLNKLLNMDRAIVSHIEGTTRDTIEESFIYKGIRFVLCDTAGIRETKDIIEKQGIKRSKAALTSADILVCLCQDEIPFDIELPQRKEVLFVQSKQDLLSKEKSEVKIIEQLKKLNQYEGAEYLVISSKTDYNINLLKESLYNIVTKKLLSGGESVRLGNLRQYEAAKEATEILVEAENQIGIMPIDCIASDLKRAASEIGKITGKTASEEIINEIFNRFCVGK